jgi:acetyl-CoA carboxylase, carboxyl transferase, alpha subunit
MSITKAQIRVKELELEILKLNELNTKEAEDKVVLLEQEKQKIIEDNFKKLSSYDRVTLARQRERPNIYQYIQEIFDSFIEMHGDRLGMDDRAIVGGLAYFKNQPVTVIGHLKGKNTKENIECNFGMAHPEGYRKAIRLMKQADKFNRPIITFIDTSGAYPGDKAEEKGQGEAIARSLYEMSLLSVPVIAIVIGEGGSGGALALSVANSIAMLENAVYSVLSPEGFASILWKDATRAQEASEIMELTAKDLYRKKIIDTIIEEPLGGIQQNPTEVMMRVTYFIDKKLKELCAMKKEELKKQRYLKFRKLGNLINE